MGEGFHRAPAVVLTSQNAQASCRNTQPWHKITENQGRYSSSNAKFKYLWVSKLTNANSKESF